MSSALFSLSGKKVWVAGHRGMVGSALTRRLAREECQVLTVDRAALDLTDQKATAEWVKSAKPDVVILAAARVGGILANDSRPVDFLLDNLRIETNVLAAAAENGVAKLLFLGSSCIYPRDAAQPMKEEALLSGPLEETNQWYAIAKIAGLKLAEAYRRQAGAHFISAMPTNLYGPNDNFDATRSHVIPALICKVHEAKRAGAGVVEVWGTGAPLREFMHVDDLADACVFLLAHYDGAGPVNVGTGEEMRVADVAKLLLEIAGVKAELRFDRTKPDGAPRKLLDVGRLHALGWQHRIALRDGLERTYAWYARSVAA